jgi:molecular chaperone HscB
MNLGDDDFTLFGLPRRFALDPVQVDLRRRELQSQVHPDRFAAADATAQRQAMQWSVRVNEAWQRLRDPLARGAYLCGLQGAPVRADDNTAMPRAFLMQQMHWREALDEAEGADAVQALDHDVAAHERTLLEALRGALDDHRDVAAAAGTVRALMFVRRLREEVSRRLEALDA